MKEKMQELSVAFAKLDDSFKKIQADDYCKPDEQKMAIESLAYMIRNISERINYISSDFWNYTSEHSKGHLPAIKSSSQMEGALEALGLAGEYQVQKPSIWVNASKNVVEVAYIKK